MQVLPILLLFFIVGENVYGASPQKEDQTTTAVEGLPKEFQKEDKAAVQFVLRCMGCHTVGGGDLNGPDLLDAATWPYEDLEGKVDDMQEKAGPLTETEISMLAHLIKHPAVQERIAHEKKKMMKSAMAKLETPSPEVGEKLFFGKISFVNGGMACVACHRMGLKGGTLGPDLTKIFTKLGQVGVLSAAENANFKVMKSAYTQNKVLKQEALHLAAFFEEAEKKEPAAGGLLDNENSIVVLAVILSAFFLVFLFLFKKVIRPKQGIRVDLVSQAYRRKV
jgi:cytochrome c2